MNYSGNQILVCPPKATHVATALKGTHAPWVNEMLYPGLQAHANEDSFKILECCSADIPKRGTNFGHFSWTESRNSNHLFFLFLCHL